MKHGFGLIEVIAAAVVLAFLLIGLNSVQKGNRESILRVRARDAANVVAQDIIDSLSALGSASVQAGIYDDIQRKHVFTGTVASVTVPYTVKLDIKEEDGQKVSNNTQYQNAVASSGPGGGVAAGYLDLTHQIAKQVEVTVNWKFKNSDQSIIVSALVR